METVRRCVEVLQEIDGEKKSFIQNQPHELSPGQCAMHLSQMVTMVRHQLKQYNLSAQDGVLEHACQAQSVRVLL